MRFIRRHAALIARGWRALRPAGRTPSPSWPSRATIADGHRRTLLLPPSLSDYGASNARFEDGSIVFASDAPA